MNTQDMTSLTIKVVGKENPGFTQDELEAAFKKVQPATHWKYPIDAEIDATDRDVVDAAINHFVGGEAEFETLRGGKLHVTAPGYFMLIGA